MTRNLRREADPGLRAATRADEPHPVVSSSAPSGEEAHRGRHLVEHARGVGSQQSVEHLAALKDGRGIDMPIYDFKSHRRQEESRRIDAAPVVIVEGILVFVDPRVRERLDMKIFVDTDADIRVFRRIRRDMEQRGRTFESVREQYYRTVRPMHLQFVEPSKRWADLIIPEGGNNRVALDLIIAKLESVLAVAPRG